ncbi:MAG: hypothetical protein HQ477_10175 [Chloroflexi bacterium]|nr:hypothetical protein [Chloroflexota bacterium]
MPLERVVDNGNQYTIADLEIAGIKASKQYDVTDLPVASMLGTASFAPI